MKTLKLLTLLCLVLSLSYCSNNDEELEEQEQEIEIDEQENTVLDANHVLNGLSIEGASKINNSSPLPAGNNIPFSIENTSTPLIGEGFKITLNTNENIAGAYLIISDIDGNEASSYFDIPESAFGNFSEIDPINKIFNSPKITRGSDSSNIIIDFLESLNAGRFCYSLCVYDGNGNISQPQTVCISIQNLGGNNNLVDYWTLARYQENYEGMSVDVGLNEEFCFSETLYCDNGNTLNYNQCDIINEFYMEFFPNGTYRYFTKSTDTNIDWEASTNSCTIIEGTEYHYELLSEGVWAYNNNNGKLLLASYYYYWNENGEIEEQFLGAGNADFLFDIPVTVSGNTFVLDFSDSEGQFIYTFQK